MPIHQTPAQRQTVERVMHEFKHGELNTARGGRKVKNPKQAVAIALSEAGASKYDTPKERAHNLRLTKAKERCGETGQAAVEGPRPQGGPAAGRGQDAQRALSRSQASRHPGSLEDDQAAARTRVAPLKPQRGSLSA